MVDLTALSSRIGRAIVFLKLPCFTSSTARFLRHGENCYIHLVDNSFLFLAETKLKLVNSR